MALTVSILHDRILIILGSFLKDVENRKLMLVQNF